MSRACRSVKVEPSVTRYCIVSTLVVSIVGAYTSDRTPPATVYQILDVVFRAVPRQSLRARSKCEREPGPPGAETGAANALFGAAASSTNAIAPTANKERARMGHLRLEAEERGSIAFDIGVICQDRAARRATRDPSQIASRIAVELGGCSVRIRRDTSAAAVGVTLRASTGERRHPN